MRNCGGGQFPRFRGLEFNRDVSVCQPASWWFCHVSRHLRCVALVELLIDHPACMMRIAMRA